MSDKIYRQLSETLDTLPNGFPVTDSGVEIKLLKKIFSPEQAELFCDLRLTWETAEQIGERTGRTLEGLEEMLLSMREHGQIQGISLDGIIIYRMLPWLFGIYEFQLNHLDRQMAELNEEFLPHYLKQYHKNKPHGFQVIPIEEEISSEQECMSYERVSNIIENSQSFMVFDCLCKKEQGLIGNPCDKPLEVCMGFAPIPGAFDNSTHGRAISKDEAKAVLDKAEEAGLVHITDNYQSDHFYICNCCGCCCGVLQGITRMGMNASEVINSHYYAVIDEEECTACGTCADERCQVNAIEEGEDVYEIVPEKCIGCGICISTCPSDAIKLIHKPKEDILTPPIDRDNWFEERGKVRGVDFNKYK
ncbi:MAG: 4Fe-4S binding protein [Deltaproteobacteria bacterium]|nr:4Fe-4S binding protein [Deltaproteobacteria bacterium]